MEKWKTLWQKEKYCHYVFKKLSAAEVSESDYMREMVKRYFLNASREIGDNLICFPSERRT